MFDKVKEKLNIFHGEAETRKGVSKKDATNREVLEFIN